MKKEILLVMVALVVLVSSVAAIDVEWECYDEDWYGGTYSLFGEPVEIWSYDYPDDPEYPNCFPVCRNIGDPYHELIEFACVCKKRNSQFARVIWAYCRDDVKFCDCTCAVYLDNYRTIKMSNSITSEERLELFFERFSVFPLVENQDGYLIQTWSGDYSDFYREYDGSPDAPDNKYEDDIDYLISEEGVLDTIVEAILLGYEGEEELIDVEWECYEEFAADWGSEKTYSCTYPNVKEYIQCYPMDRNIGLPYSELTEYICFCEQRREDDSRFGTTRIIWALDDNNIKHCQCKPASSPSQNVEKDKSDNKEKEKQEEEDPISPAEYFSSEEGMEESFIEMLLPGFEVTLGILGILIAIWIRRSWKYNE